jgi:hypothetical protein
MARPKNKPVAPETPAEPDAALTPEQEYLAKAKPVKAQPKGYLLKSGNYREDK